MAITFKDIFNCDGGHFETDPSTWGFISIDSWTQFDRVSSLKVDGSYAMRISYTLGVASSGVNLSGTSGGKWTKVSASGDDGNNFVGDSVTDIDKFNYFKFRVGIKAPNMTDKTKFKLGLNTDIQANSNGVIEPNKESVFQGASTDSVPQSLKTFAQLDTLANFTGIIVESMGAYANQFTGKRAYVDIKVYHEESITSDDFVEQLEGAEIFIDAVQQTGEFDPIDITGTVTDANNATGDNGSIDAQFTGGPTGATYDYIWSDGGTGLNRSGLTEGNYTLTIKVNTGDLTISQSKTFAVAYNELESLNVVGSVSNITTEGGSDGEITLTVTNGSGNYTYLWNDGIIATTTRTGLSAGNYSVLVTDTSTGAEGSASFVLQDPTNVEPSLGFFEVPKMQSITFSRGSYNTDTNFFDLALHSQQKQKFDTFGNGFCYFQKIRQSDIIDVQIRSEQNTINLDVINEQGEVVKTILPRLKSSYVNQELDFTVSLQNNGSNTTRIYFNGFQTIPVEVTAGESGIEIVNSQDTDLNGSYLILEKKYDALLAQEYLVINKTYTYQFNSSSATGILLYSPVDFDIYNAQVDFNTLDIGIYYMKVYLVGFEAETGYYSEPIEIAESFSNSIKIESSNFDNAFDIDYTTGFKSIIRPECIMFKRLPSTENTTIRNTDNSQELLRARPQRRFEIQFVMLPPYLYEKLSVLLSQDVVLIQGIEFICAEGLGDPEYIDRFGLANCTAIVEQKNWFGTFNSTDLGGLESDSDLVIANDGFIKR